LSGFTKLFSSILTSSIWCADDATLRVWVAMLASADASGIVHGSVPGFANLCRIDPAKMREALAVLSSPDADSRNPENEGRRIEAIPGGWRLLNYGRYRERMVEGSRAQYFRHYRATKREPPLRNSGDVAPQQKGVARNVAQRTEERRQKSEVRRQRTETTTEPPPVPPPLPAGKGVEPRARAKRGDVEKLVEAATAYANGHGERPGRDVRRKFREWAKAGCSLAEVKARIDAGEHYRRPPL
jgi:hypothetical protein